MSNLSARVFFPIVVLVDVRHQVMLSHPNAQHQNTPRRCRHDLLQRYVSNARTLALLSARMQLTNPGQLGDQP
jgi:hypothetical protein